MVVAGPAGKSLLSQTQATLWRRTMQDGDGTSYHLKTAASSLKRQGLMVKPPKVIENRTSPPSGKALHDRRG